MNPSERLLRGLRDFRLPRTVYGLVRDVLVAKTGSSGGGAPAVITLYDSIDPSQIPADAAAVAGYVDGRWATSAELRDRFPRAHLLTIAVFASDDAQCLDIESGDAVPGEAVVWLARQKARGVTRPCLYASVSEMQSGVLPVLRAAGVPLGAVRLWTAHYTGAAHRCGPSSCGELSVEADATQYTDQALGRDLDASVIADDFFGVAPPSPVPAWQEAMMRSLPELRQGAAGPDVRTVQSLCVARGHATAVDGAWGAVTNLSVLACQRSAGIAQDGICGPVTWGYLVTGGVS